MRFLNYGDLKFFGPSNKSEGRMWNFAIKFFDTEDRFSNPKSWPYARQKDILRGHANNEVRMNLTGFLYGNGVSPADIVSFYERAPWRVYVNPDSWSKIHGILGLLEKGAFRHKYWDMTAAMYKTIGVRERTADVPDLYMYGGGPNIWNAVPDEVAVGGHFTPELPAIPDDNFDDLPLTQPVEPVSRALGRIASRVGRKRAREADSTGEDALVIPGGEKWFRDD
nr:hypothetical protein [Crucivirus sp.]